MHVGNCQLLMSHDQKGLQRTFVVISLPFWYATDATTQSFSIDMEKQ